MAKYKLVPAARDDVHHILEYIATDNLDAALDVHARFVETFEMLASNPRAGHLREDLTTRPVRFFPVYSYLVVYESDTQPIHIVRVLSGAQDIPAILH